MVRGLIKSAFTSLSINKLRTFLTILGVVIGISSVITLLNLGEAAQKYIENSVSSIGTSLITVIPGKVGSSFGPAALEQLSSNSFTFDEVKKLMDAPRMFIDGISTESTRQYTIKFQNNTTINNITGEYGDYWAVRKIEIESGRILTQKDNEQLAKVAVVGPEMIDKVFNGKDPVGEKFKINNQTYTVVGVTKARGSNGFQNLDQVVIIPLTTFQKYLSGNTKITSVYASATDPQYMQLGQDEISNNLTRIKNLKPGETKNFTISSSQQALSILTSITDVFTLFLAAIGGISLLVGGIGIMNIMFVSVKERTREIGLRKALGAKNTDILWQFLSEAVVVTMLGGVIGTTLGITLTFIITTIAVLPFSVNVTSIILAVGVSAAIGLTFGIYPAWQAAKLNPIDALRYE
jgi:putative ABC transport system permease protein